MSITIRELSEELQLSKTAVNKKIEQLGLKSKLIKEGNRWLIPDHVADLIREDKKAPAEESSKPAEDKDIIIELLRAEITEKNSQIAELHKILQQQNHLLLAASTKEEEPIEAASVIDPEEKSADPEPAEEKKGFFRRLFGW